MWALCHRVPPGEMRRAWPAGTPRMDAAAASRSSSCWMVACLRIITPCSALASWILPARSTCRSTPSIRAAQRTCGYVPNKSQRALTTSLGRQHVYTGSQPHSSHVSNLK